MEPETNVQIALLREEIRQAGNEAYGVVDHTRRRIGSPQVIGCALSPAGAMGAAGAVAVYSGSERIAVTTFMCIAALSLASAVVAALLNGFCGFQTA
jgi:hypothetical protein